MIPFCTFSSSAMSEGISAITADFFRLRSRRKQYGRYNTISVRCSSNRYGVGCTLYSVSGLMIATDVASSSEQVRIQQVQTVNPQRVERAYVTCRFAAHRRTPGVLEGAEGKVQFNFERCSSN